jgi:hypothetical protein
VRPHRFGKQLQEEPIVRLVDEHGAALDRSLRDVLGDRGSVETSESGHGIRAMGPSEGAVMETSHRS